MHKTGNVVVEGVAIGKIQFLNADYEEQIKRYMTGTEEEEKKRYQEAHTLAKDDLDSLLEDRDSLSENEAEIIEAHQLMIDDITFEDAILGYIEQKMSAPSAVLKAVDDFKAMFEEIDDEYLRERQKDIVDVGNRLLRKLLHMKEFSVVGADVILCAKDIEPSIMAGLSEKQVKAILLGSGSKTSHTVIIAKAKGFVTMVGVELDETEIADGDDIIVDAVKGEIILKPSEEELSRYKEQVQKQEEQRKYLMGKAKQPAVTTDGKEILVSANISRPTDMEKAVEYGCHGVGLYRTEFLFMESAQLPDEEKQVAAYRSVAEQAGGNLCVIRTLDIGGDKEIPYMGLEKDENPFLGYRAIRLCLDRKEDIYKPQLRALLRASAYGNIRIMIPLVTCIDELREAKALIEEIKAELDEKNIAYKKDIQVGIMVETAAASLIADIFAKEADFFSIGTNDLTQYTMSVDRGNKKVSYLYSTFNPAVLRSIRHIIACGREAGIMVGMCGEAASDPMMIPLLLAFGLNEFSMSASAILRARKMVTEYSVEELQAVADKAMSFATTAEVEDYMRKFVEKITG